MECLINVVETACLAHYPFLSPCPPFLKIMLDACPLANDELQVTILFMDIVGESPDCGLAWGRLLQNTYGYGAILRTGGSWRRLASGRCCIVTFTMQTALSEQQQLSHHIKDDLGYISDLKFQGLGEGVRGARGGGW